jgi:hypothetical protein
MMVFERNRCKNNYQDNTMFIKDSDIICSTRK